MPEDDRPSGERKRLWEEIKPFRSTEETNRRAQWVFGVFGVVMVIGGTAIGSEFAAIIGVIVLVIAFAAR